MADRVCLITWGEPVRGREERALETFNDALGLYGRMQQDGRIESFDVVLLNPNNDLGGFIALKGSTQQISVLDQDEEFVRNMTDATLCVERLRMATGFTNEGIAGQMELYQEAIGKVPQLH